MLSFCNERREECPEDIGRYRLTCTQILQGLEARYANEAVGWVLIILTVVVASFSILQISPRITRILAMRL